MIKMNMSMTTKDLALIALLGACGGLGILTTGLFHALVPLPGFGATLFMPLATACLVIARGRIPVRWATGYTKLVQQTVIFFLPGGPIIAHNPLLIPVNAVDGLLVDLLYLLRPWTVADESFRTALTMTLSGAAGTLVQVGLFMAVSGQPHFFLSHGTVFFVLVFLVWHGVLRFVGGLLGAYILRCIPSRVA